MASAVCQLDDDFRGAFKSQLDTYLGNMGKSQSGPKKNPERYRQFEGLADQMCNNISGRFAAYVTEFQLPDTPAEVSPAAQARTRLEELEAQLRSRAAEEDCLRNEVLQRLTAESDDALRRCNAEFPGADLNAITFEDVQAGAVTGPLAEQLQEQLKQHVMLTSATSSLSASLEQDRANNRLIEGQRRQGLHPMESELMIPVGNGGAVAMEDEEDMQLLAELEQSQKVCNRMQQQFTGFA